MAKTETPVCDFGAPAPDFSLPGTDGKTWSLAEVRGEHGTLVMFICNHCPYVKGAIERILRDARELQALGVGVVAISANDAASQPEDSFDNMTRWARELSFPFPYLYDASQAVARAYGAVCTPDFFGYNSDFALQYRGRIDAGGRESPPPEAPRELFEAMRQVAGTGRGPEAQVPSIGCSIKWLDAS